MRALSDPRSPLYQALNVNPAVRFRPTASGAAAALKDTGKAALGMANAALNPLAAEPDVQAALEPFLGEQGFAAQGMSQETSQRAQELAKTIGKMAKAGTLKPARAVKLLNTLSSGLTAPDASALKVAGNAASAVMKIGAAASVYSPMIGRLGVLASAPDALDKEVQDVLDENMKTLKQAGESKVEIKNTEGAAALAVSEASVKGGMGAAGADETFGDHALTPKTETWIDKWLNADPDRMARMIANGNQPTLMQIKENTIPSLDEETVKQLEPYKPEEPIKLYRAAGPDGSFRSANGYESWTTDEAYAKDYAATRGRSVISKTFDPKDVVVDMKMLKDANPAENVGETLHQNYDLIDIENEVIVKKPPGRR